jgi:hypothetical protein
MSDSTTRRERPWKVLVTVIAVLFLVFLAFAFWSEREDARRLDPEALEGVEEGFDGPL